MKHFSLAFLFVLFCVVNSASQSLTPPNLQQGTKPPTLKQESERDRHEGSNISQFEDLRVLPPVSILNFDGANVDYQIDDIHEMRVGNLKVDASTVLPKDFAAKYKKGHWWIAYCVKHGVILFIQPYDSHPK